ncbi:hypothetical protein ACFYXF_35010 [Streptomyces sp. NPDC002680]|uniref:hypothetical protein n=1 Tax=Streptomyces sp. NPDC002680 TaxID=3364659 RepID=UPI00369FE7E8
MNSTPLLLAAIAYLCAGTGFLTAVDYLPGPMLDGERSRHPDIDTAARLLPGVVAAFFTAGWLIILALWPLWAVEWTGRWAAGVIRRPR